MLERTLTHIDNGVGWRLALHRVVDPSRCRPDSRPVVLVPGFAMNTFILRHRPGGPSLAQYLAEAGREVWCVELRGQGDSERVDGRRDFTLVDLGLDDLQTVIEAVRERSAVDGRRVDAVGCSLGATFLFIQAAWNRAHRMAKLVNIGGPLRWTAVHPLLRALSVAGPLWSAARIRGTRTMARYGLPLVMKIPRLLHLYLHPAICDLSEPATLVQTVDDPAPGVNRELANWIRRGDLIYRDRNLTEDLSGLGLPLLTILANADGIVPEASACSAHNVMGGPGRQLVYAGDDRFPMAHADLFMSEYAESEVFEPLRRWLDQP